jgi:hypothetical protein
MPRLQTLFACTALLVLGVCLMGCSSKPADDKSGNIGTTMPINNNAPEAKGAPAAPVDPSIQYPGGVKKGSKKP